MNLGDWSDVTGDEGKGDVRATFRFPLISNDFEFRDRSGDIYIYIYMYT